MFGLFFSLTCQKLRKKLVEENKMRYGDYSMRYFRIGRMKTYVLQLESLAKVI